MKPNLIIISRQFPYGYRETFLESEIPILSSHFKTITIYPSTNHKNRRPLPTNVYVNDLICTEYNKKIKWSILTIFSCNFFNIFSKNLHRISSIKKIKALIKYCISYTLYKNVAKIILENNNTTVIYSYWYNPFVDAVCDIKKSETKIVTRVHRGDLYEEFTELGFYPKRECNIYKVEKIFSISQHGVEYLQNKFNVNNVTVSRLGVGDKQLIAKRSADLNFSIVSVSNVFPVKNVPLIATSIMTFALNNPNISIKWNHFGDGQEMDKVKNIIYTKKLKNLDCVFHGMVANNQILEYYSINPVDLFVNLSSSEGIPVSIMEAISFGIPILATDVGGVSEIVNETNGILLQKQLTADFISKAISNIFNKPLDRAVIRDNWARKYSAQNNYTAFAKELASI